MTANQIAYQNYKESVRANKAREAENTRTNTENEAIKRFANRENVRHNVATEGITSQYNTGVLGLRSKELDESVRHNKESESIETAKAAGQLIGSVSKLATPFIGLFA